MFKTFEEFKTKVVQCESLPPPLGFKDRDGKRHFIVFCANISDLGEVIVTLRRLCVDFIKMREERHI